MPILWLLLPFGALVVYYQLRAPTRAVELYDPNQDSEPLGVVDVASVPGAGAELASSIFDKAFDFVVKLPAKIFTLPSAATPYAEAIATAESKYGLPESLLARVLWQESRFRPDIISGATRSPAGAVGIAQFLPSTARDLNIDPTNPYQSIDGAAAYLRGLYNKLGDWAATLAAYNWGIGNVQRKGLGAAPTETKNYVAGILSDVSV